MEILRENGLVRRLNAETYSLRFAADRPYVYLESPAGQRLADLFALSAVHPLHDRDDTTGIGAWEAVEAGTPADPEIVISLVAQSSTWARKIFRFRCQPRRLIYEVEVEGAGRLAEVNYFGGYYSGHVRWGSGFFWSGQHFQQGFNPEPNTDEANFFGPAESSTIDLMGVPLPGRADWFFTPPPFCFAFQAAEDWLGLGVQAAPGANTFTEYRYHAKRGSFYLSLSYEGHTAVEGAYRLPGIVFDFGAGEYDVLALHVLSLHAAGALPPAPTRLSPAWWHEPILCGWGTQSYAAALEKGRAPDYSRQSLYEELLSTLEANAIAPGCVVLDDKWQATYGENRVDEAKWPDLPGFVQRQHAAGRKVLLWLKAWDPENLPAEECITNAAGLPIAVDPGSPAYARRLRESVRLMLSPEGYDADGFKIDFTARIPSGPGLRGHGPAWGLELMHQYLELIYTEAKAVKPDALVMTHTPHPYLADVLDMIRLNDINMHQDIPRAMRHRARVAAIACPAAVIDTDNWPITDKAAWRAYVELQPELGVPSLYYATHIDSTLEPFNAGDYELVRQAWARYRARRAGRPSA